MTKDEPPPQAPPPVPTVPAVPTVPPAAAAPSPAPDAKAQAPGKGPKEAGKVAPKELMKPPSGEARSMSTRPIRNPETDNLLKQGKLVGPVVTHLGAARADGSIVEPIGKDANGIPIYETQVGSGFILVVEGKPGLGNMEIGRKLFVYDLDDPKARPDLEIQATRDLGDGSKAVCDRTRPNIGGMPGINPPNWSETLDVSRTLADWACRFETFIESQSACIVKKNGEFTFVDPATSTQFCMTVARAWVFPEGDTLVSARLRDVEGNPGPVKQIRVRRPKASELQKRQNLRPSPTPVPTQIRRRP